MAKSVFSDESPSPEPVSAPVPRFLKFGDRYLSVDHIDTVETEPDGSLTLHIHGQLPTNVSEPASIAVVRQWLDASTFAAK